FQVHQLVQNEVHIFRFAIRSEAHEFVFAGIHLEAAEVSERAVEQAERMWKVQRLEQLDLVPLAVANRSGVPLANAIQRQDRRLFIWRREKSARGVGLVMSRKS